MTNLVLQTGYFGLFAVSYLSATLLPFASELFVIAMPRLGFNSLLVVIFATLGSFLGSLTNYYIGLKGTDFLLSRYVQVKPESRARAEAFFQRWGPIALFFSWVPLIGDPLTAVAGGLHVDLRVFSFWVLLGKTLRTVALVGLTSPLLDALGL